MYIQLPSLVLSPSSLLSSLALDPQYRQNLGDYKYYVVADLSVPMSLPCRHMMYVIYIVTGDSGNLNSNFKLE